MINIEKIETLKNIAESLTVLAEKLHDEIEDLKDELEDMQEIKEAVEKHFLFKQFAKIQDDRDTLEELLEFNNLQNGGV